MRGSVFAWGLDPLGDAAAPGRGRASGRDLLAI